MKVSVMEPGVWLGTTAPVARSTGRKTMFSGATKDGGFAARGRRTPS